MDGGSDLRVPLPPRRLPTKSPLDVSLGDAMAVFAALQSLGLGVVVLESDGRVRHVNDAARDLIESGTALLFDGRRLTAADPEVDSALRDALGRPEAKSLKLTRHPASADDAPLLATLTTASGTRRVLLLSDAGQSLQPVETALVATLGVTPTEAVVARLLAEGCELTEIATRRETTLTTVRAQLRAIFAKTGAKRQADLVRLVLQIARLPGV